MSDKVSDLVNYVKQLIQDGNRETSDCIKQIENEIDSKQNEIRELFSENIESVISHYIKYHATLHSHKKLENDCEEFSKRIEKTQKLNVYDEQQIEKSEKNLEYMKGVKAKLAQYKNYIKLAKKAAFNIKEEKYNNAIKIINQYKKNQPKLDTPLKGVLPILEKKVEQHLRKLLDSFWEENKPKMMDIGRNCFSKMSSNYQEKLNIYQIFFGKSTGRSSISNRMSSFRCTMLTKQTSSRILKSTDDNSEYFNKIMVRINVEMSTLKKVKLMVVELNNQGIFNEMLRVSMKDFLTCIQQVYSCEKQQQFVEMLSIVIGFLLIKRQVCAFFDLRMDQKVFLNQIYLVLGKQIKNIISIQKSIESVKILKENLLIFHKILNILGINDNNERYNMIVLDLLKSYNTRNMQNFEGKSTEEISKDNLTHFATENEQKEYLVRQVFDLNNEDEFRFTSYVVFVLDYFLKTYQDILKLIEESDTNQNVIFESVSELYEKIMSVYGSELLGKDQHYQIIQGEVNVIHINKAYKYLVHQLEMYHGIVSNNKLSDKYEQLIVKLTRNILEVIRQKLERLMEDYSSTSCNSLNDSYHDFVEWTLEFIYHIIVFMKQISCPNYEEITIQTMREMCELYWKYLTSLKEINLIIIYNLDLDLSFIYRFCAKNFSGNMSVLDKFKSLREFYALMLTNNLQDLLEPQKRVISYPNLNLETIIAMLKKYNQAKSTGGKVRQLKKKDVQNLLKKLLQANK